MSDNGKNLMEVSHEPASDPQRDPVVTELERELLRQIGQGGLSGTLVELGRQSKARYDSIDERLQSLHDHVKGLDELNEKRHTEVTDALKLLTEYQSNHAKQHEGETVFRQKQDSFHEIADRKHEEAIRELEMSRVQLVKDQALLDLAVAKLDLEVSRNLAEKNKSLAEQNKTWAKRGKLSVVFGLLGTGAEAAIRIAGVDGIIGLLKLLLGGH